MATIPLLRLTQTGLEEGHHRVEASLEVPGRPRQTATTQFAFTLTPQDQEDFRWYLEDYLQYPLDPAPTIAARIEQRLSGIGTELFKALFQAGDAARDLWATLRASLNDTRVEIVTGVHEAASIPWELLRDPKTDAPLALRARTFVRALPNPAQTPRLPKTAGSIRILLVICRPGAGDDVPFRSVAGRLVKSLSDEARQIVQLEVLRPPTFEQLSKTLRAAKARGEPYHVVHFDGHGMYLEIQQTGVLSQLLKGLSKLLLSGPRTGSHGYLAFENPKQPENLELVDGPALGKLLVEANVPVLVLNACRSAYADPPAEPRSVSDDPHGEVRAYGTLAQEIMDAGVAGVVAMRYNVYVVTAAQFVVDLYGALLEGATLGEAVTRGRQQLEAQPLREIAFAPRPLQDWPVPVIYEAAPLALFPKPKTGQAPTLKLDLAQTHPVEALDLPPPPDVGFYGRDETLLALDRAFDTQNIVLLHAFAGSGKTAAATEFARWYTLTGGLQGPVLFTSFEQYKPLPRVLDSLERVFGDELEREGVNWLALSDDERQRTALKVLQQIPVLWIWDNVEPVAGFPAGTASAWSEAEQGELRQFLSEARATKAKFLLTSRRDEQSWLGNLPRRIAVPPMPLQERVQLARALAEKFGHRITDVEDWRPLLHFTQGNPLTITVLVGQALRNGLKTRAQIEAFVDQLRTGEAAFEDEISEGRSKSLGASLSYGFANAFSKTERRQLALLHCFQGFVDVEVLRWMGYPKNEGCLPEVRDLTREAGIQLLDRAAEVGLLTAHGGGYYRIHPALPWYFKSLFDHYYAPAPTSQGEGQKLKATRAFVEAMGALGNDYANQYECGNRDLIAMLSAEEANLLHARQLARTNGWWRRVISTMQGLHALYNHTGRRAEWARLVQEIVPDFVNPKTDGPLAGREEQWGLVTEYRVRLAMEARQWAEAERLQRVCVEWARQRAAAALTVPPNALDDAQRNAIRTLAASLHELGKIQRELGQAVCVKQYEEALKLSESIGEKAGAATCASNLGHAYMTIPALRDLAQAERWYRRSLELHDEYDRLGRGQCLGELGHVAWERFQEARDAGKPETELLRHLNEAVQFYSQALELLPPNAVNDLAVTHNALGVIYDSAGDLDRALPHYREAIRYSEAAGDLYHAGMARFNVARALAQSGRFPDAREYTLAALRNFETYGDRAAAEIEKTRQLLAQIESALQSRGK
ncbi:MAG: CHAT domain-containing protein [Candidatus Competibacteraceae bacterium]